MEKEAVATVERTHLENAQHALELSKELYELLFKVEYPKYEGYPSRPGAFVVARYALMGLQDQLAGVLYNDSHANARYNNARGGVLAIDRQGER